MNCKNKKKSNKLKSYRFSYFYDFKICIFLWKKRHEEKATNFIGVVKYGYFELGIISINNDLFVSEEAKVTIL